MPNTVSPHLDTWFSRLGARIADPQAFRAPAADDTPAPVQALAAQLWDTAQALARGQAETRALAAEALQRQAQAAADDLRAELALQRAHAAAHTRELADAHAQRDALRAQAQADVAAASERATAAERRAAADMDRERQARLRAEQLARDARAESDHALADERARSQAQFVEQVQALASALQERLDRVEAERLRVRIRERRADSAGGGSPSASRARGAR